MPNQYEREEAVRRAKGMLTGGFDAQYLYEKFLSEKFSEDEAAAIVQEATGRPFKKPIKLENKPDEVAPIVEIPAAKVEDAPVSFASLLDSPTPESQESKAEVLETLDEKLEAAQDAGMGGGEVESLEMVQAQESSEAPAPVVSSPALSQNTPNTQYRLKEAKNLALTLFSGGYGFEYIQNKLLGRGFTEQEVKAAIEPLKGKNSYMQSNAYNKTKPDFRHQPQASEYTDGSTQVIIGVVMILLGCGITFFSYQAAANNPGGGTYVVTFGLIIAGAFRVFKGLSNG